MAHIRAAEAPVFTVPGFEFRGLTSPSRGAQELCTWQLIVAPQATSDTHSMTREEIFILLEGTLTVTINGASVTLTPGDAVSVPMGAMLQVANSTRSAARAIVCIAAGFQATLADGQQLGTPPWAQ